MTAQVLVVDDLPDIRLMLGMILRREGLEVVTVEDGPAAHAAVAAQSPVGIVMDYRLEHELGTDVIRELRAGGYDGPFLLFSAHLTRDLRAEAAALDVPTAAKTDIDAVRAFITSAVDGH